MEYGAVVVWWVALVGLGVVGLPIAATLLRPLPDRGAGLALPAALLVLFLAVYWIGHLAYGPAVVALGGLILAAVSLLASRRSPPIDRRRFGEWVVVLTLAFLLVVAIRAVDPSVVPGGGEKFLDYGLLRAVLDADRLPPEDLWFAGEPVAYYYGGHLLAAALATLTDTAPKYAYNLALAGVYATVVAAVYGLAGAVAEARGRSYRLAGALGAVLFGFASNVVPLVQAVLWVLPRDLAGPVAAEIARRTAMSATRLLSPDAFNYWTASRVIPVSINEFPLFAYLNGDLHAHMSSTIFLALLLAVGFAYVRTPAEARRRRRLLVFGAIPPVAGTVAVVNTWSLPGTLGLAALFVLFADSPPRDLLPATVARWLPAPDRPLDGAPATEEGSGPSGAGRDAGTASGTGPTAGLGGRVGALRDELARVGTSTLVAAAVGVLSILWVAPFTQVLTAGPDTRSIGVLPDRSGLLAFLLVHGWFLAVFGSYLLVRANPRDSRWRWPAAGTVAVVGVGVVVGAAAAAVVLPLLALAWYLLRRRERVGYETVLFVAGAGLVVIVEFLYLEEPSGPGRFNTVFKTYAQVWVLWATGAAVAIADLVPRPRDRPAWRRHAATGLVAFVLLSSSIYGVVALGGHFQRAGEPTLDATTWARTAHADEWEAIQFLDRQPGRPTIVSAPGCYCNPGEAVESYQWANAPSTFSGAATVAGWDYGEDYHGFAAYRQRVEHVRAIYTGDRTTRRRLLARYDVEYVYVGPNERTLYGEIDLSGAPGLTVAHRSGAVTIYAVDDGSP